MRVVIAFVLFLEGIAEGDVERSDCHEDRGGCNGLQTDYDHRREEKRTGKALSPFTVEDSVYRSAA